MRSTKTAAMLMALAGTLALSGPTLADEYEVTITNITQNQLFTPFIVVSHKSGVNLFDLGEAASLELEMLAEGGATGPLADALEFHPKVIGIAEGNSLLMPGEPVTLTVATEGKRSLVSLAAMLLPTNDGFVALNGERGPKGNATMEYLALAYDAGTEANDQDCDSIPGGASCGNGSNNSPDGVGFVHVHPGIHDIGDLSAAAYDWRNPVAKVTIRRLDD